MEPIVAAALILLAQQMPVTRPAGGPVPAGQAAPPQPRPPAPGLPVTRVDPGAAAATLDSPRRLSLTFAEPRPIEEVLRLVIAGTPFSLSIDPDVTGTFRGELKQLTLREALTALLAPLGLQFEVSGTILRVTRTRTETREFDIDLLAVQRGLSRTAGPANAALTTAAAPDDVFAGIAAGVQTLLSPNGKVHVDRRAGLAQVTDYPERLDRVGLYLEALQARSGRQVRLQARVFEVTLRHGASIDWSAVRDRLGLPREAVQAGLAADPAALQQALAEQGDVRVLSAPEVTAMNNEPALMRAATSGGPSLTLTVVAQIAAGGVVQLSVSHAWEEQNGGQAGASAEADTVARVADGTSMLIAGLLRQTQVSVPARGFGSLFGGQPKEAAAAELVVLLQPTVVTPGPFPSVSRN